MKARKTYEEPECRQCEALAAAESGVSVTDWRSGLDSHDVAVERRAERQAFEDEQNEIYGIYFIEGER